MDPTALLREMGEAELAGMLARRPDLARPAPASLGALVDRMLHEDGVLATLARLPLPTVQVAEAATAMGGAVDTQTTLSVVGRSDPQTVQAVDRALNALVGHGLALRDGPTYILVPAVTLAFPTPLGLNTSVEPYLRTVGPARVQGIATALGIPSPGTGRAATRAVLDAFGDTDLIRGIVDAAPEPLRDLLLRLAHRGGAIALPRSYPARFGPRGIDPSLHWAISRCLLIPGIGYDDDLVMPSEIALALRGPEYHAPFEPVEPYLPRVAADEATVARDAAAAAAALLRVAARVLEEAGRGAVAGLRSGGVGVRELRRIAKVTSAEVEQVRLALALLHGAGLLAPAHDGPAPTDRGEAWLAEEPPRRMAILVAAWWSLPYSPLTIPDRWEPTTEDDAVVVLRARTLDLLAQAPGAPTDHAALVELVRWRYPLLLLTSSLPFDSAVTAWHGEAALLGVLGAGAVSDVGRALLAADPVALEGSLAAVGQSVRSAHLQADLTAVVAGTPTPELSDLLARLADREAGGAASTWRFSPESIRRALDAGSGADAIITALAGIASAGVPQTLTYLVRDVARRHGTLRATEIACSIRGEDTALLAEVAADRRLRDLGLRLLAPTVLGSQVGLVETLAALRKAGYAPVAEAADGSTVVEQAARRRTVSVPRGRSAPAPGTPVAIQAASHPDQVPLDVAQALARTLLDAPQWQATPLSEPSDEGHPDIGIDDADLDRLADEIDDLLADIFDGPGDGDEPPPPRRPRRRS